MIELPSGTVTFLFTDIEGSTRLAQEHPDAMPALLARHNQILKQTIEAHHGHIFRVIGDSFSAAFHNADDALHAALEAQWALQQEPWSPAPIKVRMGIHTGAAQLQSSSGEDVYTGYATLALSQRIMSAGHGGQTLLSQSVYELTRDGLPKNARLVSMGEHHLKDVLRPEHIYQLSDPELVSEFPPLNTLKTVQHNLPIQLTSFVGREKELSEIKEMLHSARLVTLTGSGATGKTRLAIDVGAAEFASFAHGVWLIELAPLTDESQIIPAIAQTFGLQEHPFGPLNSLIMDYLRDKKLLLILDNCEHLIEACARLADNLLHHCAGLRILASSREALGIAGESAYRTPSLAGSESTQLFLERARAANPRFFVRDANASSVAQICSRLDGIPLAIELAAARTKLLSVDQIAARLNDRFRLLVGGSRTALPRQQTLRALIDWSYDLLSDEEKGLFRTASVFIGGWTLGALEAVADDTNTIAHLEQLVNKSLVVTEERNNEMRYFMLETIRQYAREKLFDAGQASTARDRHFLYFDHLAETIWDVFRTENIYMWRNQADDEMENLRAAVEWGIENQAEKAIRLAANFCLLTGWIGNQMKAGLSLCRSAIDRVSALPPVQGETNQKRQKAIAKALFALGRVGLSHGNIRVVLQDLQDAIDTARAAGDKRMLGYSLEMFFTANTFINAPHAEEAAEEGFRIFTEEIHDIWGLSMAYQNKARVASYKGNDMEKERYLTKLRELIRHSPLSFQAGLFYLATAMNEKTLGNYNAATRYIDEGLSVFNQLRNWNFQLIMISEKAHVARYSGRIAEAKNIYLETLKDWQNMGNRGAIANQLECFAFIDLIEEEPQRAVVLLGAADALREAVQSPMTDFEQIEYAKSVDRLRSMLTEEEFRTLWTDGRTMP